MFLSDSSQSVIFTVLDDAAYPCSAAAAAAAAATTAAALKSLFHTLHNPKVRRYEATLNLHKVRPAADKALTAESDRKKLFPVLLVRLCASSEDLQAFQSNTIFDMEH